MLVIVTGAGLYLRRWITASADAAVQKTLQKHLEEHRHSLRLAAAEAEFEHQRRLHDLALYSARKHEILPRLYSQILQAWADIRDLHEGRHVVVGDFEQFDEHDLERIFQQYESLSGKQAQIRSLFGSDRAAAKKELNQYLRAVARHKAEEAFRLATETFFKEELYLPNDLAAEAREALSILNRLNHDLDASGRTHVTVKRDRDAIPARLDHLRDSMRSELQAMPQKHARDDSDSMSAT